MPRKYSKRLVIDACIARAAGGDDATFPTSKHCRDFLRSVLNISHRIIMTPELSAEWKKHQSRFARGWLVSMQQRKKVIYLYSQTFEHLRTKINEEAVTEQVRQAMIKDCHLLEASLGADSIIVSLDNKVKDLFTITFRDFREVMSIVWINPDSDDVEQILTWMKEGAKPEKQYRLGYKREK
jgi:hypothetical protein